MQKLEDCCLFCGWFSHWDECVDLSSSDDESDDPLKVYIENDKELNQKITEAGKKILNREKIKE